MDLRILHISDTHGVHHRLRDLPEADILVHSGDFTMSGSEAETLDFLEWLCDLPYRHKVLVAGNHDACLYGARLDGLDDNVHYLCGSGVEIEGLKFWGVPMFMEDCILDRDGSILYGSRVLLERVRTIRPRLHLFGHIHKAHGTTIDGMTVFSNAAIMDEGYDSLNGPNVLTITAPEH